jgi:teichuronic acid biosynthesis glycosyltransferase TuaC
VTPLPLRVLVYSSLFPGKANPNAGIFIKERLFRLGQHVPIVIVSPQVSSPFDRFIRLFSKNYRTLQPELETLEGVDIWRPRVFSIPKFGKALDGWFMARGSRAVVQQLVKEFKPTIIDAHFAYPDGYAATRLARLVKLPCIVTLRGSKDQLLFEGSREKGLISALKMADGVICVSKELQKNVALRAGVPVSKTVCIGNGVNLERFNPEDRIAARQAIGIDKTDKVLIAVGNLVSLKGHHRLIDCVALLVKKYPDLRLLIVGGEVPGDSTAQMLKQRIDQLGLQKHVSLLGKKNQESLKYLYSAADLFVSATQYEGWANVLLEAMACGLPVVTTNVGGNSEVVSSDDVGLLVPYWDQMKAVEAIEFALAKPWRIDKILEYANSNEWEKKIQTLKTYLEHQQAVFQGRDGNA